MLIHDWSRVDANVFHHFHQDWTIEIARTLNRGILPADYTAMVDQHAAGTIPDVLTVGAQPETSPEPRGGGVMTIAPRTRMVIKSSDLAVLRKANRIVVRHAMGRILAVIEVMSPGNKASASHFKAFVEKTVSLLSKGVHVLVIDLFPPTNRDPQGIHKAIYDEIEPQHFELPDDRPLTLASYVADVDYTAYVEPVKVGESLPDMPLYLTQEAHVMVPLDATYATAWENCAGGFRSYVAKQQP